MPTPKGRFVWYDHMTTDTESAASFYTKVVGWGTEAWNGPMPYTMFTSNGVTLGGTMTIPAEAAGAPPHWIGYISTPDIARTLQELTRLGGAVHRDATDIPGVGQFAIVADPQGAVFAPFTPSGAMPGHTGPPRPGDMSWHELVTTDRTAAWSFYQTLFGWERGESFDMGPMGTYQLFTIDGLPCGGMMNKTPDMPMPPSWLYYAMVADIDAVAERVRAAGGQVINGPTDVPGGDRILQGVDPKGGVFALHQRAAA